MFTKARLFAPLCFALATAVSANAANYCLAIRGNGELEAAHWGAVANVVERLGLPQMQAGGSSASITMLLTDAIATNRLVKGTVENGGTDKAQGERAALLLKSLHGVLMEVANTKQWREVKALFGRVPELRDPQWAENLMKLLASAARSNPEGARKQLEEKKQIVSEGYRIGRELRLFNTSGYQPLFESLERLAGRHADDQALMRDLKIAGFYARELYEALSNFGTFNAESANLFFRPGILNFDKLALQFGRIADLYSMQNLVEGEQDMWSRFMSNCAKAARGVTWEELVSAKPDCQEQFSQIVQTHFASSTGNFATQPVGVTIPSFPITAVLTDKARDEFLWAKNAYERELNPNFGANFVLTYPQQVRFGYWGPEALLSRINQNLVRSDEKSRRFLVLDRPNWTTPLGLSPAEPGLSALKPFTANGEKMVSAGGWPDLEPIQILRAAGCENVVFATRRGGPSKFGVRIAERLLGKQPLDALYNLENPQSSLKQALSQADAVLCTSWDQFKITQGVGPMIFDAYKSPFYVNPNRGLSKENLSPLLDPSTDDESFEGCY